MIAGSVIVIFSLTLWGNAVEGTWCWLSRRSYCLPTRDNAYLDLNKLWQFPQNIEYQTCHEWWIWWCWSKLTIKLRKELAHVKNELLLLAGDWTKLERAKTLELSCKTVVLHFQNKILCFLGKEDYCNNCQSCPSKILVVRDGFPRKKGILSDVVRFTPTPYPYPTLKFKIWKSV